MFQSCSSNMLDQWAASPNSLCTSAIVIVMPNVKLRGAAKARRPAWAPS
jgi:hypothetical protein